jgi:predicted ATP-dependent endonuclease of OLD family
MSRVRKIEIKHFRSIEQFEWMPGDGINCLIGSGDSGKSSVLDAIDLCLGVRRSIQFGNVHFRDSDFHRLDVTSPIQISLTIGALDDSLKSLDHYGFHLRGFNRATKELTDEPEAGSETVLTLRLTVNEDLEPIWSLYSDRAEAQGESKNLHWSDRIRLASTRLGEVGDHHLSWKRGSLLHRLSDERTDVSADLAKIAREARKAFGATAKPQVSETLKLVETANDLGISVGEVSALLDSNSISFSGGTICLHDGDGVPLRGLGLGSTRLLVAALQRQVASRAGVVLLDEVEHGLEPHRIMRLLDSLGAKEKTAPLQVFMTTHSPVAIKELSIDQLYVLRQSKVGHEARHVGPYKVQGTVRGCPDAFLAPSVLICEGATEVGFLRGLDAHRQSTKLSITARGVSLTDGVGENAYRRVIDFASLGYPPCTHGCRVSHSDR